ncbi:Response regulator receiver protein [Planktothrix serta PCC 8927]|uniref:Response regulator receiver protein n=1 Tax=Planktothrix serta PCC 8927 TaxID=671068 RepID=A0A7Z9BU04_9CYAN|nr:response regulator [Planktothrix serta]VXD22697.1 Response regulator receiver protein [Planktothrix serta PCC 8927]
MTKKILVVDDEELILEVVQACLEDLVGWGIHVANSGQEALKIAAIEPLDAVLLDVSMPEMDGIETLKQLQDHPINRQIPVILLTAKVLATEQALFSQFNIAGLIKKPFDPMSLHQQIASILGWDIEG